jgi:carbon starvation protein
LSSATVRVIFNNRLDAAVTGVLVVMVTLVLVESVRQWIGILSGARAARVREAPFVRTRLVEERG